ncbi:MAG: N-acetyl-gamma-glutamyl-phosphate reductase [Anaerolineae bacterium]
MVRVGIFGATGYAGYELVKILRHHPQAEVIFAASESHAGKAYCDVYPCNIDLPLIAPDQAPLEAIDVAFLCTPNGVSAPLAGKVLAAGAKCIDFSADLRLYDVSVYNCWYSTHPAPELLSQAVYGLSEVYRPQIAQAALVANPGCYTTCALLALYPLAKAGLISREPVIIDAKSGVSGAGVKPTETTHFVSVNDNFSTYKIGHLHRHVPEIEQELAIFNNHPLRIVFSPHLLPVARGILETLYISIPANLAEQDIYARFTAVYQHEPFVQVLPLGQGATLAHTVGTNRCTISIHGAGAPGEFILVSTLDNLVKGASGQAVQNMNIMFGLDETSGLN